MSRLFFILILSGILGSGQDYSQELKRSLDDIFQLKGTSVTGIEESVKSSPAAITIITSKNFKKSGHQTVADVLRTVPGFHVAQLNSSMWAVSSRGFNGRFANKLLVLIDGRSVYTPLFSGVFWDIQDMPLNDIERIEVIRGPGATLWGANAVNGVINIVTKSSRDTLGGYLKTGGGTHEQGFATIRYGEQLSDTVFARVWGKYFNRYHTYDESGHRKKDNWDMYFGGFRTDWYITAEDSLSILMNYSRSSRIGEQQLVVNTDPAPSPFNLISGTGAAPELEFKDQSKRNYNFIVKWKKETSADSGMSFQAYYDYTNINSVLLRELRSTVDLEYRQWFLLNETNSFIWGVGIRSTEDDIDGTYTLNVNTSKRRATTYSAFLQNTTQFTKEFKLMYGSKFEYNDYTGLEVQPSVRFSYDRNANETVWAAVSRTVRTPSRTDDDVSLRQHQKNTIDNPFGSGKISPYFRGFAKGDSNQRSEEVFTYEVGYRRLSSNRKTALDITVFYNDYDHLATYNSVDDETINKRLDDVIGHSWGAEASLHFKINKAFDVRLSYTHLKIDLSGVEENAEGESPENMFSAHMEYKLTKKFSMNTHLYYVGQIEQLNVESYIRLDCGFIYRLNKNSSIALWGFNLTDPYHPEFYDNIFTKGPNEIKRSFLVEFSHKF